MDETQLRREICQAAHQLWTRGLIVGDGGVVTVELHRRRYLSTPPQGRRPNLQPSDVICVDMGGLNIQGGGGLSETQWRVHRAAYKASMRGREPGVATDRGPDGPMDGGAAKRGRLISATVLAEPPIVMAMLAGLPATGQWAVGDQSPIPLVTPEDEQTLIEAVERSPVAAVHGVGLLAATRDLDTALNWIERVDHAARLELAMGGRGQTGGEGDLENQADPHQQDESPGQPQNAEGPVSSEHDPAQPASEDQVPASTA